MTTDPTVLSAMRFGLGLPLPKGAPVGASAMLEALRGPDVSAQAQPLSGITGVLPFLQEVQAGRMTARKKGDRQPFLDATERAVDVYQAETQQLFARALDAPDGFRERLALFWADHFTIKARNRSERLLLNAIVDDAIRPNMTGRFADLLTAAVLHPAMLVYLDQVASVGPGSSFGIRRKKGLNENLAREVLELHTLGVGAGYSQADVRQMAMLLTGLDATAKDGFIFRANRAEPGAEVVLGKSYGGEGMAPVLDVLQDLALRPETARHIATKLVVHFVADVPPAGLVDAIAAAWRDSGGDLMQVYGALLSHPLAWEAPMSKARQPFEFMQAALRGLGVSGGEVGAMEYRHFRHLVLTPMGLMGQAWQAPVGPDGWAEAAENWITPQGLGARIAWGMQMPTRLRRDLPDPRDLARLALGDAADAGLIRAVGRAESVREGVGLVFASPAFNRR